MSDLIARLNTPEPPATPAARRQNAPSGFQYEWDGVHGHIQTGPLTARPKTWDAFIRDAGLDPEEVEVEEPVQVRGWDAPAPNGAVVKMHYYRLQVRRYRVKRDLDALVKAAKTRRKPKTPDSVEAAEQSDLAFVIALGDLQLGKVDGDGVEGTVARFIETTRQAIDRHKRLCPQAPIYLFHLGDCIEGFQSQGGANAWRTTLTTTEQVRLYRRLLLEQVKDLAAATSRLVVAGVPGNHDEAHRPLHTYGDSWAIEAMSAVRDALDLAGDAYAHVTMHTPARDELTLTFDIAGTKVGLAHGHQWKPGQAETWWARQSHGRQPIGDADMLLSAHLHHLRIVDSGVKTWIQVPALESESTWWRHATGEVARPGIVTMLVGGGTWRSPEVLTGTVEAVTA